MAKQNQLNNVLLNEINEVHEHKLNAFKSHVESILTVEAWGLNSRQQCIDEETGKYLQFIDPKSYKPIQIYQATDGDDDVESNVEAISSETEDEEMTLLDRNDHKDGRMLWIGIALAGMVLGFLIAILFVMKSKSPEVVTAAHAVIPIFGAIFHQKKKSDDPTASTTKINSKAYLKKLRANANAMIVDETTHKRLMRKVEDKDIPKDSFLKIFKGKKIHILGLNLEGKYWTIKAHAVMVAGQSPLDLFIAKHCAEEVRETFGISSATLQKIKIGVFVCLIFGILIVTFMMVTAASGGTIQ
jgi:hypothetical protein